MTSCPGLPHAFRQLLPNPRILSGTKRASVAVILRPSTSTPPLDVLLVQRAPRSSDPWSAHLALPGGRRDQSDADDLATAVREVREEVGLDLLSSSYACVGRLHDRPIRRATRTDGVLSAFVFLQLDTPGKITVQATEIASVFWVSIRHLHAGSRLLCTYSLQVPHRGDTKIGAVLSKIRYALGFSNLRMPALDVLPHGNDFVKAVDAPYTVLWGMTLDILGDLVELLGLRRVDRPALLPDNRIVAGIMWALALIQWFLTRMLFWRRPTLDRIFAADVK